jgi:cytochrome b involved in lipid metabolism
VILINAVIWVVVDYFLVNNLPIPLSSKVTDDLKKADVLGAQTSAKQPERLSYEVTKHDFPADCWIEYSGKVYDITAMLYMDATLSDYCGQDATEVFDKREIEERRMLAEFLIQ